jgi:hypothetical protein
VPRSKEEFNRNPEYEKWCRERAASPEGERLLDELARCFVDAAVRRLLKEEALRRAVLAAEIIAIWSVWQSWRSS